MKELNLIPYSIKERKEKELKIRNYIALGIILLCILFISVYIPALRVLKLESKEDDLKKKVSSSAQVMEENEKITNKINDIDSYINKIDIITKKRVSVSDRVKDIEKYIPQDVVLKTFDYENGKVTLNGTSVSYNSIPEFLANLQGDDNIKNAKIIKIDTEEDSEDKTGNDADNQESVPPQYTFSIVIEY